MTSLTVLTQRIDGPSRRFLKATRRFARNILLGREPSADKKYGGHHAVTRSLVEGLQRLGADFNYNPRDLSAVGDVVVVLTDVDALRQAIVWKRDNRIKGLLAGPNLMVFSNEYGGILGSPEVDVCLVPSDWVRIAYEEDVPNLKGRIRTWWAGVDETYWKGPAKAEKFGRSVVIYKKNSPEELCENVERILIGLGWSPQWITYGQYSIEQYKRALSEARFGIFLSQTESQGIALAEAWAMDVPTLVWNPKEFSYLGRRYTLVSACPYLSPATGREWAAATALAQLLTNIDEIISDCKPRAWVLRHMTDALSARALLEIADCSH